MLEKGFKMKILIFGGTGAMGVPLTRILAERGHEVFVTSRSIRKSEFPNVSFVQGSAKDLAFVTRILKDSCFDVVVDFMAYGTNEFKARYNLMLESTKQYVFTSSARVFAECAGKITEESPRLLDVCKDEEYLATDEYALAKARQEDLLKASGKNNWTIIRPSITYNDYRLQLGAFDKEGWLYRALHGRSIVMSKDVSGKLTAMASGEDVAKGIASVIGCSEAFGCAFNIASEKSYTWREILEVYLDAFEELKGSRPAVFEGETTVKMKDGNAKYQIKYARSLNRSFDCSAIGEFVDVRSFVDAKDGLKNALMNFLKEPRFGSINWKHEAWNDKEAGEWTPLGEIQGKRNKFMYWCYRRNLGFVYNFTERIFRKLRHSVNKKAVRKT